VLSPSPTQPIGRVDALPQRRERLPTRQVGVGRRELPLRNTKFASQEQRGNTAWNAHISFMFPTWYRFQITSTLSILPTFDGHCTGCRLALLAWWLVAVAAARGVRSDPRLHTLADRHAAVVWLVDHFFYHLCSGIRISPGMRGYGFEIRDGLPSGYASSPRRRC